MVIFADTSFFVSLYGRDAHSPAAQRMASALRSPFAYTPLLRLEVRNALRLACFRKELDDGEAGKILSAMGDDVAGGSLWMCPLPWMDVFAEAERLIDAHTPTLGTRSLDVLHVASAVVLKASLFCTFDRRQGELARKAGLKVKP